MEVQRMTVNEAARILGKNPSYVRVGLQRNLLPFGSAVKVSRNRYNYHICPAKFYEYLGINQETQEEPTS